MKQASELMERKRANIEAKKEARRKAREEQERIEKIQREEEERKKSWSYWANKNLKFW
jgi:cytochrome c oxidase assembly protein subunit 20